MNVITIPCCLFVDSVMAIYLNILAKQKHGQFVPEIASKPAKLSQAILARADELADMTALQPVAVNDLVASQLKLQSMTCKAVRVDYLDENLNPIYSTSLTAPTDLPIQLFYVPCEKQLSYTKRAYASKASVTREFSSYLQGLLPAGFDLNAHICRLTLINAAPAQLTTTPIV